MSYSIIFVSGVHGVGKGTLCETISENFNYPAYSSSNLIKSIKQRKVDDNKRVVDPNENQNYLITALEKLKPESKYIILDGHFCLHSESGAIDISFKVFNKINLKSIILLTDKPSEIYKRLYSRDNSSLSLDIINTLQERERERSRLLAKSLSIPLLETTINDVHNTQYWLNSICQ